MKTIIKLNYEFCVCCHCCYLLSSMYLPLRTHEWILRFDSRAHAHCVGPCLSSWIATSTYFHKSRKSRAAFHWTRCNDLWVVDFATAHARLSKFSRKFELRTRITIINSTWSSASKTCGRTKPGLKHHENFVISEASDPYIRNKLRTNHSLHAVSLRQSKFWPRLNVNHVSNNSLISW